MLAQPLRKLALNTRPFNPRQLVQLCADRYGAAALRKQVLLFACIDTDIPPCVMGDAHRIQQVINHFLGNALKFTSSGQIIARLRSEPCCGQQAHTLTFQVVDSGIGITAADQQQLLAQMDQASRSAQILQETRQGLSLCASLATLMGGEIRVTSEQGLGSSFALVITLQTADNASFCAPPYLSGLNILIRSPHAELSNNLCQWLRLWGASAAPIPLSHPAPQAGNDDDILLDVLVPATRRNQPTSWNAHYLVSGLATAHPAGASAFIEGYSPEALALGVLKHLGRPPYPDKPQPDARMTPQLNLHLLVAEDDPINQAVLRDQLVQLGCTATVVSDGQEALSHWAPGIFDAVLTDVNMPNMNGYDLARSLRHAGAQVPIIGVTANTMRDEEARCKAAGMSVWMPKPIDLEVLHQCLIGLQPESLTAETVSSSGKAPHDAKILQSILELAQLPKQYHNLFRDSMNADADILAVAARSQDVSTIEQTLHRMQGALLSVQQRTLADRMRSTQSMFQYKSLASACDSSLGIALDLKALIAQYLP